jgi:hypothetical protein
MTVFYSRHDSPSAGHSSFAFSLGRACSRWLRAPARRAWAALLILHRAIVTAKTRRLEREPALREIPRCPVILGDKWDF